MEYLPNIPRELTKANIDQAIENYKKLLDDIPISIKANNVLELLKVLKRSSLNSGPYPNVSIFESANRIMTDLVILFGVKKLLNGAIKDIEFEKYKVEFGNENLNDHDIVAYDSNKRLIGEAFNVAESFFQTKKAKSLKKLRESQKDNEIIILLYNSDAVKNVYNPKNKSNEYYISVDIEM